MLLPTIIMGIFALVLVVIGYYRGQDQHVEGLKRGFSTMLQIVPMLIFAFIVAGMVQVLVSREALSRLIGEESGIRGILVGTIAGGFAPGGPYVSLPLAAGFMHSGAGVGTMVAFLTSWSLWAVSRLPMEVGIMGWRFTVIRLICTFFFPPIAGLIANLFFHNTRLI